MAAKSRIHTDGNRERWGLSNWLVMICLIAVIGAAFIGWSGRLEQWFSLDAVKVGDVGHFRNQSSLKQTKALP